MEVIDIADVISELDDHGFADTLSARKVSIINDTIADICSREVWPFLKADLDLTFDGITPVPSNWPTTTLSKVLSMVDTTTGLTIVHERQEVMKKQWQSTLTTLFGDPNYYYFQGTTARLWPVPNSGRLVAMTYLKFHPAVTASTLEAAILLPARHHRMLVLGSLYKLYAMEDDPELSAVFKAEYEDRGRQMREDLIRQAYDQPDRIYVLNPDDYDTY